jgi:hypothetical protein
MHRVVLLWVGLLAGEVHDYNRPLDAKALDKATFEAGQFGEKKKIAREADGLHVTIAPGEAETGWKAPQALKLGGDFTIAANFEVRKLPKPAQEDGVAVGLAIATQNIDQPDATLIRLVEMSGADVYRAIDKAPSGPQNMPMGMAMPVPIRMGGGMPQRGAKPAKPPRRTFRARGKSFRLELRREGGTVRYHVQDEESAELRYLGQVALGTNDIAGVKVFVTNRNGGDAVDVVLRTLTIHADRVTGLGTEVRTVFGEVVHGEPTALEGGKLIVGGPAPAAPAGAAGPQPRPQPGAPAAAAPAAGGKPSATKAEAGKQDKAAKPADDSTKKKGSEKANDKAEKPKDQAESDSGSEKKAEKGKDDKEAEKPADDSTKKGSTDRAKDEAEKPKDQAKSSAGKEKQAEKGKAAAKDAAGGKSKATAKKSEDAAKKAAPPKPEPKAKLPLDEVESISFERATAFAGRVVGQPNIDFAQSVPKEGKGSAAKEPVKTDDALAPPPGTVAPVKLAKVEPKPSGIRDLHVALSGLRPAAIKQVTVNAQTDKGATSWRLDTSGSNDWPLVLRRAGTETWADLFLEPPAGDLKDKQLTINITYGDGQSANAQVKSEVKTDNTLAFDPKAPAASFDARIYIAGDEQLFGKVERLNDDSLRLRAPWGEPLDVPLAYIKGIYMGLADHKESAESFARRLRSRGAEDLLLARSKDGEVVAITGIVEAIEGDRLRFVFQEKPRTLALKQVEGLVFATRAEPERPAGLLATFSMAGGIVVSGQWTGLEAKTWKIKTSWGATLNLPAAEVQGVRFRGGQMTYLSDLEPSRVEETPYFSRRNPWRKDVTLSGSPLKVAGRNYDRGLAVHSRSALTYELDGKYARFEAVVGFDESARGGGRVDCRVFAGDKEIYANPDLRADAPPVRLSLPVAGAERLRLVVDFGPDQDTGDRLIWANARLYRSAGASASGASSGGPQTSKSGSEE